MLFILLLVFIFLKTISHILKIQYKILLMVSIITSKLKDALCLYHKYNTH